MRLFARVLVAAAFTVLPAGVAVSSCGTDAAGIQACRSIEYARCMAAPTCMAGFDTSRCERFYRDECLVGLENAEAGSSPNAQPCVDAIDLAAACAPGGDASPADCLALIPDASCREVDAAATACNVILDCPEILTACAFVAPPPGSEDAGTADADAATDAGDAGDAGG